MKLLTLYKGKGATPTLIIGEDFYLNEMGTKIVSSIIAHRLLAILEHHMCLNQFRHIGYQEALLRCHHGLETCVLFVDIVKAFDLINHELMYSILSKLGVPKNMINRIQKMYSDCIVHLEIRKERRQVQYTIGVQQGDNMDPILFFFFLCKQLSSHSKETYL